MARHHSSSDESSDDENAPQIITLAQSKKDIQKLDAELKKSEVAVRQSKRRQNREVDRKLKERADINRGGLKKGDDDDASSRLEARMQRAMQEAQEEEMNEEDGSEDGSDSGNSSSSEKEAEEGVVSSSLEVEQGEEEDEEAIIALPPKSSKKKTYTVNHLPDELFAAAFASKASTSKRKPTDDPEDNPNRPTAKKPKHSNTQRDLLAGSKTIRMLPIPGQPITPSAAPSSKVNKFLNRSLALKGGKQQSKTWERRPANIGVFRRDGPASNFVRNR